MHSCVQVGEGANEKQFEVLHRWGDGVRRLLLELEFLRRIRAEKAREMELAERLFHSSREELLEIKARALSEQGHRRGQNSLDFSPGKSLFCTQ
jgi:hypothetical protein